MSSEQPGQRCDSQNEESKAGELAQLLENVQKEQKDKFEAGKEEKQVFKTATGNARKRKIQKTESQEEGLKVLRLGKRVLEIPEEVMEASYEKPQIIDWKATKKSLNVILVFEGKLQSGYTNDKFVYENSALSSKGGGGADGDAPFQGRLSGQPPVQQLGLGLADDDFFEKTGRGRRKKKALNYAQMVEGALSLRQFEEEQAATQLKARSDEKRQEFEDKLHRSKVEGAPMGSTCSLCHLGEYSGQLDVNQEFSQGGGSPQAMLGKLIPVEGNTNYVTWVHIECARWSTDVNSQDNGDRSPSDRITAAIRRGRLAKCGWCRESGASISCVVDNCESAYHLKCAKVSGCYMRAGGFHDSLHFIGCPTHSLDAHQLAIQYEAQIMSRNHMRLQMQSLNPLRSMDHFRLNLSNGVNRSISSSRMEEDTRLSQIEQLISSPANRFQTANRLLGGTSNRDNSLDFTTTPFSNLLGAFSTTKSLDAPRL